MLFEVLIHSYCFLEPGRGCPWLMCGSNRPQHVVEAQQRRVSLGVDVIRRNHQQPGRARPPLVGYRLLLHGYGMRRLEFGGALAGHGFFALALWFICCCREQEFAQLLKTMPFLLDRLPLQCNVRLFKTHTFTGAAATGEVIVPVPTVSLDHVLSFWLPVCAVAVGELATGSYAIAGIYLQRSASGIAVHVVHTEAPIPALGTWLLALLAASKLPSTGLMSRAPGSALGATLPLAA